MRIINSHAHIGDIFHLNLNCSFRNSIKKGDYRDYFEEMEDSGFTKPIFDADPSDLPHLIDGGQYRCWEFGLEQLTQGLDESGVEGVVLLPCPPNTTFEEYLAASKLEPRIIPFTGADMSLPIDVMVAKLKKDIGLGAKGLKLHPVLQNVRATDDRVIAAAKVFGEYDLPVVIHVGEGIYYHADTNWPWNPDFGKMSDIAEFARILSDQPIIAAHSANTAEALMESVKGLDNVYADTSFCSAQAVRTAVRLMGPDRILFGSDSPFTHLKYAIQAVDEALCGELDAKDKIFYRNIAKLCHL